MPAAAAAKNVTSNVETKKIAAPSEVETKKAKDLLKALSSAADEAREAAAQEVVAFVAANGVQSLAQYGVLDALRKDINNKKNLGARLSAIAVIKAFSENSLDGQVEPYVLPFLAQLLELQGDKQAALKNAAADAATTEPP